MPNYHYKLLRNVSKVNLSKIIKNPYFLKDREELFNYQLFYEIKKAGLENMVDFELLEPIIDKNGYDLLIKYRNSSKSIQLKCAERNGTNSWDINQNFFKPVSFREASTILPMCNAGHLGLGGGVILIEYYVNKSNSVDIKYFYTDFVCISFFLRKRRSWSLRKSFPDFIKSIFDEGDNKRKFILPKSLFFEVSIEQMLYLSRVLPPDTGLLNSDTWFFSYPNGGEMAYCTKPIVKRNINILRNDGSFNKLKIEIYDIFQCDHIHKPISINKKMSI